jgi:hypothetical protein
VRQVLHQPQPIESVDFTKATQFSKSKLFQQPHCPYL